MIFAFLGNIPLGSSSIMTGPGGSEETLSNTIHEHNVVRGKPVPQSAGEELDTRSFSFLFDESFCEPQAEYAKLLAAHKSQSALPLVHGNGAYLGKSYAVKSVSITHQKATQSGRIARIEATIDLIEVPGSALSLGGLSGIASAARALLNPLTRR